MFTGIVSEMGCVLDIAPDSHRDITRLTVQLKDAADQLGPGASIALAGVCLTALEEPTNGVASVEIMGETLSRTTLGSLKVGDAVNVERAMSATGRFDGHIVQGHVDTIAPLIRRVNAGDWDVLRFALDAKHAELVVPKGSIALDGVSLTVSALGPDWFEVSLIPVTLRDTTLGTTAVGDSVNVEFDVLAKHLFASRRGASDRAPKASRGNTVEAAIAALAAGNAVIVRDADDRENEGDIIFAAQDASAELMGFTIRHSSGVVCVPMSKERLDALDLPPMVSDNQDPKGTNYAVSCDVREGTTTGISAADRAATARALASPDAVPAHFHRPGHMFPLGAHPQGIDARAGHTEAALQLMELSGKRPVAVIAELTQDDGSMMRGSTLETFAAEHGMPMITIEQLRAYTPESVRGSGQLPWVEAGPAVNVETSAGPMSARAFRSESGGEHLVLSAPTPDSNEQEWTAGQQARAHENTSAPALVRVHSECVTGDVFSSTRCDCGDQLEASLKVIAANGGHLIYLRGHEGRGIGLFDKIRAYAEQDRGLDTIEANLALGHEPDSRTYADAAAILINIEATTIRLITNNPDKRRSLEEYGVTVTELVHVPTPVHAGNLAYLSTKQERMGHRLKLWPREEMKENHG